MPYMYVWCNLIGEQVQSRGYPSRYALERDIPPWRRKYVLYLVRLTRYVDRTENQDVGH